jgi:hypothetical protein
LPYIFGHICTLMLMYVWPHFVHLLATFLTKFWYKFWATLLATLGQQFCTYIEAIFAHIFAQY